MFLFHKDNTYTTGVEQCVNWGFKYFFMNHTKKNETNLVRSCHYSRGRGSLRGTCSSSKAGLCREGDGKKCRSLDNGRPPPWPPARGNPKSKFPKCYKPDAHAGRDQPPIYSSMDREAAPTAAASFLFMTSRAPPPCWLMEWPQPSAWQRTVSTEPFFLTLYGD